MTPQVFFCTCGHNEHQVIINAIDDFDDGKTVFVTVGTSLCDNYSFWSRVRRAIKYVLGHRSNYGMFAETILSKQETIRLIEVLSEVIRHEVSNVPN